MRDIYIPTFDSDGSRIRNYSLRTVNLLVGLGKVTVVRNRKGHVIEAHYRKPDGKTALTRTAYIGSRESYPERIEDTAHRVWKHKDYPRDADCDYWVRQQVFLRVQLDCMKYAVSIKEAA